MSSKRPRVRTVGTAHVASMWRERRLQSLWSSVCVTQQWYPDGGLQQPWHTHCVYVLTRRLHIVLPSRCRERCSVRLAVSDSCDPVTVACRAPLSLGCFRHAYYGGCHFLLEGIFLTQGPNPLLLCLLHRSWILYLLSQWGSPVERMKECSILILVFLTLGQVHGVHGHTCQRLDT